MEKDPIEPQPAEAESYSEEDALQDLLDEMNTEQEVEEDTIDIFNITFDDKPPTTIDPSPKTWDKAAKSPEPQKNELTEEEKLISQIEQEAVEEFTFTEVEELIEEPPPSLNELTDDDYEETFNPTLDDKGLYIGPTTIFRGDHILELEKGNYVIVGNFRSYKEAEQYADKLFTRGYYTQFGYLSQTEIYYVYIFGSKDMEDTKKASANFKVIDSYFKENWVLQVK